MAVWTKLLPNTNYQVELEMIQSSQSISGNYSNVSWSFKLRKLSGSGFWSNDTSTWSANIGGQGFTGSGTYDFRSTTLKTLLSGTKRIDHAANGTGSVTGSTWFSDAGDIGSGGNSGHVLPLTTIPRTSAFTIPTSFNVGSAFTVSISRASSSFTHWVSLHDGETLLYSSGNTVGTSDSVNVAANTLIARMAGVKSKTFTVRVDTYNGSTRIGGQTKNITANIPVSTPTTNHDERFLGETVRIYMNRVSSSFTHTVDWLASGNQEGTVETNVGTYVDFTLPSGIAWAMTGTSRSLTFTVKTYSGSTYIGSNSVVITAKLPDTSGYKPSFSALTVSENVSAVNTLVGAYVQGKSRLNLAITGASGVYGSSIRSYRISGVGHSSNSSSTVTGVLSASGNQTITGTITDSRGQSYSKSIVVNILPYSPPTVTGLSFKRTLPDKTEAPLGDNATVTATVQVHSLVVNGVEKNSIWYHVQSAQSGGSFADKENTTYASLTAWYSQVWSGYSVDHAYNFRVRAADVFGWSSWSVGVVPTGIVTQQWGSKTTSFGKMIDNTSYNVQVGTGGIQNDGPIIDKNGNEVLATKIYSQGVNVSGKTSNGGDRWIADPGTNNALLVVNLRTVNGASAASYRVNTYLSGTAAYIRLFNSSGTVMQQTDITFNYVIYLL